MSPVLSWRCLPDAISARLRCVFTACVCLRCTDLSYDCLLVGLPPPVPPSCSIPFNLDDIVAHLPPMQLEEVDLPPELQNNASLHFLLLDAPPISASPFFSSSPAMSPSASLLYHHPPLYTPQPVASARGQRSHQFELQAEAYQRASTLQGRSERGSSGTSWDIFSTRSSTTTREEF